MKRVTALLIILLAVIIFSALGWFMFVRNPEVPIGETISGILPFGSGDNLGPADILRDNSPIVTSDEQPTDALSTPTADLFRLSDTPVAGSVVFKRGNQSIVRYVERATGHIYEILLPTNASSTRLDKTRITNNTLPKVYEAHFRGDGGAVLVRQLRDGSDVVENLSLTLTAPSAQATSSEFYNVSSTAIRGDIGSVAVGTGNNLFYSLKDADIINTSAFNGTGVRTILNSPFTDWLLISSGNNLVAQTKASSNVSGFAYTINTSSGGLTKLLGGLDGLLALPNSNGSRLLYSYNSGSEIRLVAKNLQTGKEVDVYPITLAEKCVWSSKSISAVFCAAPAGGVYLGEPDQWYRGATHFSDNIWKINTQDETFNAIAKPSQTPGIDVDATYLKLSPDEDYLIFTNKNDLSLWALRLEI